MWRECGSVEGGGGGAAGGGGEGGRKRVRDMQRGHARGEGCVRAAMSALVSLELHIAVAEEEEHVPLLQVPAAVR